MFKGRTNNEMLKKHMEMKGKFSNKMLRAHLRSYEADLQMDSHFDDTLKFKHADTDKLTGRPILRLLDITQPTKDIQAALLDFKAGADDRRVVISFADLLEKCLMLDPAKRHPINEILKHNFFTTNK